ncbi:receptor serine/threonine kinase- putative [Striga hermonthica]|uniref:Receptor serine/threonine kinase- putative n=1 Tax=Striga hermonthica TaxID=68872 RepID=A0A9N7QZY6_STRHE|nr:receptor serine/threonine kinase- putative [Striga hermonthica]
MASGIVISLLVFAIIMIVSCVCARRRRREKIRERKAFISELRGAVAPPILPFNGAGAPNHLQTWDKADNPTIEKFFIELAQENPLRFTARQLCAFTNNYTTVLGSGGFGRVYKGEFPNGAKIAVKVLNRSGPTYKSVEEQFMAETGAITRTRHANLVRLYGFCYDQFMSALVYEFMENGSLDRHLFVPSPDQQLPWEKLHEIAVGTARGIAYLHEECGRRIIHYDIKPGNVLLDRDFTPKVADFGLAKQCDRDDTHVSNTGYRGTPGYLAPEFLRLNFPISYKCDVYSFGILLFEIVGRRRNVRPSRQSSEDSLDWFPKQVWEEFERGDLMGLVEACGTMEENDRVDAERMARVALWCVQESPELRPTMSVVVKMLEGEVEIMLPPNPFNYWFSKGPNNVLGPPSHLQSGSSYTTSEGANSYWYKQTTPTMAEYEIAVASHQ